MRSGTINKQLEIATEEILVATRGYCGGSTSDLVERHIRVAIASLKAALEALKGR